MHEAVNNSVSSPHSTRELLLLAQSPSSAQSWNIQQVLESPDCCEPTNRIAQSFSSWIEKLWEQNGDGRKIASRLQIHMAVLAALSERPCSYLNSSKGLSETLAACLVQAAGVPAFEEACLCAVRAWQDEHFPCIDLALTAAEQEALIYMLRTQELLGDRGYIDEGSALSFLCSHQYEVFTQPLEVEFIDDASLTVLQKSFFDRCSERCQLRKVASGTEPLQVVEGVEVQTAIATGAHAQPQLLLNIIHSMLDNNPGGRIVVTCKDPKSLFDSVSFALADAGISCSVQASTSFAQTDFGRAYILIQSLENERRPLDSASLTDLLLSPLCGLPKDVVWRFNKALRGNRLMTYQEAKELIQDKSPVIQSILENDFSNTVFEARFRQLLEQGVSPVYVHQQQAAYYALRDAMQMAQLFGIGQNETILPLIEYMTFPFLAELMGKLDQGDVSTSFARDENQEALCESGEKAGYAPQVRIMTQQAASSLVPKSIDFLIMCDLTTVSYPLQDDRSSVRTLLQAIGIEQSATVLNRERVLFNKLIHLPSQRLVLERCQNDENADPLYPSAMLQELQTAYQEAACAFVPAYKLGEDDLVEDIRPTYPSCEARTEELVTESRASVKATQELIVPHSDNQAFPTLPRLSPSQIEAYLDCPYKWFVANRLGVDSLDEDLGPRQRGSFLHEIFQRFYHEFGQKVTKENLNDARQVMFGADGKSGLFDKLIREQYELDSNGHPRRNRFVPLPHSIEMIEFENLKTRVNDWLVFETTFLPTYRPIALEQSFAGIEFEGCELAGIIDRIDVDDSGHVVIIDYKGSLSDAYDALGKDGFNEHGKVQALLYAMLVDKLDTLPVSSDDVVGALYVSYNNKNEVRGAYKSLVLGKDSLPTLASVQKCALLQEEPFRFSDLLDFTAERIAGAIEGIKRGEVAPQPQDKDACTYCPVLTCEKRGR